MVDVNAPPPQQLDATNGDEAPAKKKKKKKYSSKSYKRLEKMDRSLSKASRRMARAISLGVENWEKNREKSARKKKDGAMVKVIENSANAFGTFVRKASRVPSDLARFQPKIVRIAMPFRRK